MNVIDGVVHRIHELDGALQSPVFVTKRRCLRNVELLGAARTAEKFDTRGAERSHELGRASTRDQRIVNEQRLEGVARGRVINLRIDGNLRRHVQICILVNIHVHDAIRVSEHGNLCVVLNVRHQRVGSSRNDEIDHVVELQKIRHRFSSLDETHALLRNAERRKLVHDDLSQFRVRARRFLPTLEQQPIPRSQRQRRDLRQRVRSALKNDQQHAQRRRHLGQRQTLRELHGAQRLPDRLLHVRDRPRAVRELLHFARLQFQSLQERLLDVLIRGGAGHVFVVRGLDFILSTLEGVRDGAEELDALVRGELLELTTRIASLARERGGIGHGACVTRRCVGMVGHPRSGRVGTTTKSEDGRGL